MKEKIHQGWRNLKSWIAGFIPDWIKNPWNSLVTWFDEVVASIQKKWEVFKSWLLDFMPDWLKSWMGIQDEAANAMANVDVNSPEFKLSSGSVFDIKVDWAALESGWEKTKIKLKDGWGVVWDGLTNGASGAWKLIEDGWENTCKWIGDVGNSVWNGITKAWDWIWGNSEKTEQQTVQAQVKDLTILNKMYEGFEAKVQEMTNAWNPFKKSLGEGFQNIFNIMKQVGDIIRTHVITAV
ncbi:MAG: hypothetical protein IJQ63_06305, partial [Synergistaceae bacterium]|nr:hypothetical protein [Synergistaceae bacterium]